MFFGSTEPSVTPKRSAALRLAVRKSRMPCSDMMRAASCASARRRFSARGDSFFIWNLASLENRVRATLWRIRRGRIYRLGAGLAIALVALVGRQHVRTEVFVQRI